MPGLIYSHNTWCTTGLVGRNGTGKTTFLRHMAMHAIEGIPKNCQILHVEQEVTGDDITALQCVLNTDIERSKLLEEEASLLSQQVKFIMFQINSCGSCSTELIFPFF